jgi:REP element-mobilizing transposase RayT
MLHIGCMARPLRIEYAGALHHVIARGNNRGRIANDSTDARVFVNSLEASCERFDWRVYAWCLMPNHYHLVLETLRPTLSRGMQRLNGTYAQYFNRRHSRVGHVFQARFKSFVVEQERYLLALLRYVELNPCRAGLVKTPMEWPWSSVHVSLGARHPPVWSSIAGVWSRFHTNNKDAIAAYRAFLMQGLSPQAKAPSVTKGLFVGSDSFVEETKTRHVKQAALSSEIRALPHSPTLAKLARTHVDRDAFARAAYAAGFPLKEIADQMGVHYSTVSRIAHRSRPRMRAPVVRSRGEFSYVLS